MGLSRKGNNRPRPSMNVTPLVGGLAIAGTLYLLVTLIASGAVPTAELAGSSAPLVLVGEQGPLGVDPKVFAAITLFALANGALINMIMASRLVYGMSEEGIVPGFFGRVLSGRRTPITAIAFTTAIGLVLVSTGDLASLADTTVLLLLCAFTIVNVAVLVLRRDEVPHSHFRVPTAAPVLGAIVCAVLIVDNDAEIFLRAGLLLILGAGCGAKTGLPVPTFDAGIDSPIDAVKVMELCAAKRSPWKLTPDMKLVRRFDPGLAGDAIDRVQKVLDEVASLRRDP